MKLFLKNCSTQGKSCFGNFFGPQTKKSGHPWSIASELVPICFEVWDKKKVGTCDVAKVRASKISMTDIKIQNWF